MNIVIIVSVCLRVFKLKKNETFYEFHFRGVYAGSSIKRIILAGAQDIHLEKDKEYLIKVNVIAVKEGILRGEILKIKSLDEYWDKS
jgi:hypothetical protein